MATCLDSGEWSGSVRCQGDGHVTVTRVLDPGNIGETLVVDTFTLCVCVRGVRAAMGVFDLRVLAGRVSPGVWGQGQGSGVRVGGLG